MPSLRGVPPCPKGPPMMNKYGIGLVFGKFYPFHNGHKELIQRALDECGIVLALVLSNEKESIPAPVRTLWINRTMDDVRLITRYHEDNLPVDYGNPELDLAHSKEIVKGIGHLRPDFLYTSEEYGDRIAGHLSDILNKTVVHRYVEPTTQISATEIRENIPMNWHALPGPTREWFVKDVVVSGPESSGTTTLARALAKHYGTTWVPEFGRLYSEAVGPHYQWASEDFEHIAREHQRLAANLRSTCEAPLMIWDTNALATCMFHKLYLEQPPTDALIRYRDTQHPDLHIIADHSTVPFEQDGTRLFEENRNWQLKYLVDGVDFDAGTMVIGTHKRRMQIATATIDTILKWDLYEPEEAGKIARG